MLCVIVRILFFGLLFIGCSNPFSNKEEPPFIGVWGARIPTINPQQVAFLSEGRYLENNTKVGLYTLIDRIQPGTTNWIVRIDYDSGETVRLTIVMMANHPLEFNVANSSGRGPSGFYDKLHTGDGL